MKKIFAFFLLLCHMNGSMLLPQVTEEDVFVANGVEMDDINSVTEYIDQVILGNEDDTPEDEDNDNGQQFHLTKQMDVKYTQVVSETESPVLIEMNKIYYADYINNIIVSPFFEIPVPPPDLA